MSNKTPKVSVKKTKSAPSRPLLFLIAVLVAAIIGLLLYGYTQINRHPVATDQELSQPELSTVCLKVAGENCDAYLEVADTDETRIRGLSGRSELGPEAGMVFVSDQVERQCFWMRGMLIPLDMIWLDENKVVTKVEANIQPETYPTQFCSVTVDKYVIELAAGRAEELGIVPGKALTF